ncbi:MAG: DGQHR domain-containing protein [Kiritimatiellaeota bacterium]|nr:DGQHR domain-containing protein [Kiritimatiellota bacterium]
MPFTVPAIRFVQKGVPMYLAALPVNELDICSIDRWDPKRTGKWKGYQRGLVEKKIANLAQYLERPDGILPVAGLLNVRSRNSLRFSGRRDGHPIAGQLTIPDETRLWVVDMQHRLAGIKEAHSRGFLAEFSVPVLITEGLSDIKEACQFYIINTKSKRMGVDLTRRLMIEHNEVRDLTDVPAWELTAVRIALRLNHNLRDNPWYGRIREPESERLRDHIATEKSFVPSLKWLLTAPRSRNKSAILLARFLGNFWQGIRANAPEAFATPRAYLIQKTPGYMAFHRLTPIAFRKWGAASAEKYTKIFRPLSTTEGMGSKVWERQKILGL